MRTAQAAGSPSKASSPNADWTSGWRFFLRMFLVWNIGAILALMFGPREGVPAYGYMEKTLVAVLIVGWGLRVVPDDSRAKAIRGYTILWALLGSVVGHLFASAAGG